VFPLLVAHVLVVPFHLFLVILLIVGRLPIVTAGAGLEQ
jgi:hypothetical protein